MGRTSGTGRTDGRTGGLHLQRLGVTAASFQRCVTCCVSRGDDYKNHIRCISEDQKYGGKGYEAKANKGDVKQQLWLQVIGS